MIRFLFARVRFAHLLPFAHLVSRADPRKIILQDSPEQDTLTLSERDWLENVVHHSTVVVSLPLIRRYPGVTEIDVPQYWCKRLENSAVGNPEAVRLRQSTLGVCGISVAKAGYHRDTIRSATPIPTPPAQKWTVRKEVDCPKRNGLSEKKWTVRKEMDSVCVIIEVSESRLEPPSAGAGQLLYLVNTGFRFVQLFPYTELKLFTARCFRFDSLTDGWSRFSDFGRWRLDS
ncbi:hypothetical protein B0I72DRAFT_176386 [Yarrowia lipolytica]|uniref:Uncharacterized protein n=1 Tax=Yarrowia lipolytica TaxID=4952 RepID=A0A371C2L8_YARLL|nr:hypothetical protein B0I71DRAFT_166087 [Yarrowia lipolytica]RDW30415.1 hypothetical protein B0I72DRAFT_176386 [Yarrowia lipolytica]RDW37550.1 hypothetical protein B0I73DRAFT_170926 [Yarrowia lipolytica]